MTARRPTLTTYLVVWALIRTWSVASGWGILPYPNAEFLFSDVRLYDWWAVHISVGEFPVGDEAWQYPPLAALVFLVGFSIAPDTVGFIALTLVADVTLTVMLFAAGRAARRPTELPIQIWLAGPLLIGPIAQGRFDVFPTLLAVAGLLASRRASRGALWAVGTMLKVWPGMGLLAVRRRDLPGTAAAFLVATAVLWVPLHMWWPQGMSFLGEQRARGLQIESVGALPYMARNVGPGTTALNYQYGAIEVVATHTDVVATVLTVCTVGLLGALVILRLLGRLDHAEPADVLLAAVLSAMATSRVLSPQYNLWLVGLVAACALMPGRHFTAIARLVGVTAVCGHMLYPWLYTSYEVGGGLAFTVQVVRIVCLVAATVLAWRQMLTARPTPPASPVVAGH